MPRTLEECIDEYLLALAEGRASDLEDRCTLLPAADRPRFRALALALEFLWRRTSGEPVAPEAFSDALDAPGRELFFETVVNGQLGGAALPHQTDASTIVGERFVLLHELGEGGQARVFAAWDRVIEHEVALKLLNGRGPLVERAWESSLREESKLLARLNSRNIVRLYDLVRDGGESYLVMDRVRGVDLNEVLQQLRERGPMLTRQRPAALQEMLLWPRAGDHEDRIDPCNWYRTVAGITEVMAQTVALAHAQGVVHRDLKPSNIMLVGGGEPVLLDFGLASREGVSRIGELRGTPAYLAPEQARALATGADPLTDVYQLGAILYELLTLHQAIPRRDGEDDLAHLQRVARAGFDPPRSIDAQIPEALEAICLKAMASEKERRYRSAAELAEDLARFRRGLAPRTAVVSRRCAARMRLMWLMRRPTIAVAMAGILLALGSAFVFAGRNWEPPDMEPFFVEGGSKRRVVNGERIAVERAGVLGMSIDCHEPGWLYAFSVYGGDEPGDWVVRPLAPELDSPEESNAVAKGCLSLAAGRSEVRLTKLVPPSEHEGVLIFFSREENDLLACWWQALEKRDLALDPMRYEEALALAHQLDQTGKGESLARISAAERRTLFAESAAPDAGGQALSIQGVSRHDFVFLVETKGETQ